MAPRGAQDQMAAALHQVTHATSGRVDRVRITFGRYANKQRGGHVHQAKVEHFYILSGKGVLKWVEVESGGKGSTILAEGDKVTILPGLAHQFEALQYLVVVEYYAGVHDPDDDIPFLSFE